MLLRPCRSPTEPEMWFEMAADQGNRHAMPVSSPPPARPLPARRSTRSWKRRLAHTRLHLPDGLESHQCRATLTIVLSAS